MKKPIVWKSSKAISGESVSFRTALTTHLASDGGLYCPDRFPRVDLGRFTATESYSLQSVGEAILREWIPESDPLWLEIPQLLSETFQFEIPLVELSAEGDNRRNWEGHSGETTEVLELYHGPTAAFKDVGARFLAASLSRIPSQKERLVLVATSGDTGGAVAGAFFGRPGFRVAILYPKGRVSARQAHQLCAWGGNVQAFEVEGSFDDCQRVVKQAFQSKELGNEIKGRFELCSANSINIGRLLPQTIYYAWASITHQQRCGVAPGFVIPSGNLGNAVAALYAKKMGFPVGEIVLATNANATLLDYARKGRWEPRESVATLANAMDVGAPSNFERWRELGGVPRVISVSDAEIQKTIRAVDQQLNRVVCPHTATAFHALRELPRSPYQWIIVSTAHPAKFETIVEPLIGRSIEVPPELAKILGRTPQRRMIRPVLTELVQELIGV